MEAGALTLASPEVRFKLDSESQNPTDVQVYALKQANQLVEEFMLFANISVGRKILRHFPTCSMLRRHPSPSRRQFDVLIAAAESVGLKLSVETSRALADSLDLAVVEDRPYLNKLLRIMATRCMKPAAYFCSGEMAPAEYHHYGLAAPIYLHFTSPIRRYADVAVHRLLAAAIGWSPLPKAFGDKGGMNDLAQNLNKRHHNAQQAGRASVGLYTLIYFSNNACDERAQVMKLRGNGLVVLVPRFGLEGTIQLERRVKDADDGEGGAAKAKAKSMIEFDAEKQTLVHKMHPGVVLRVFDDVKVHIEVKTSYGERKELVMTMIEPFRSADLAVTASSSTSSSSMAIAKTKAKAGSAAAAKKKEEEEDEEDEEEEEAAAVASKPASKKRPRAVSSNAGAGGRASASTKIKSAHNTDTSSAQKSKSKSKGKTVKKTAAAGAAKRKGASPAAAKAGSGGKGKKPKRK